DLDGAVDAYQKGLDLHPNDPDLLNNLARVYSERQDFEAAGPIYAQLVRDWPNNSDYLSNLGIVQWVLGDYKAAYQTGLKVIQMDPRHPGGYVVVGQILHASGKVDEAREVYQEGLRQNPDHQELRALLASTNG
ncbi:MAG: tetratricopeptide repeat protein, partial [bacterium]|nr:tetratricopeptide repeat protein [bacterium]